MLVPKYCSDKELSREVAQNAKIKRCDQFVETDIKTDLTERLNAGIGRAGEGDCGTRFYVCFHLRC